MFIKRIFLKADLGVIWDLPAFGRHLVEMLADVPVPAPVQLRLVLDQAQPEVIRSVTKFKDFKLYRKFETNIPRNETAWPRSQILHACFCERFMYIFPRLVRLFCCITFADRSREYKNSSQKQKCRNWERRCTVSFMREY